MKIDGRSVLRGYLEGEIEATAIIESRALVKETGVFGEGEFRRPTTKAGEAKEGVLIAEIIHVSGIGGVKDIATVRGDRLQETERRIRP